MVIIRFLELATEQIAGYGLFRVGKRCFEVLLVGAMYWPPGLLSVKPASRPRASSSSYSSSTLLPNL